MGNAERSKVKRRERRSGAGRRERERERERERDGRELLSERSGVGGREGKWWRVGLEFEVERSTTTQTKLRQVKTRERRFRRRRRRGGRGYSIESSVVCSKQEVRETRTTHVIKKEEREREKRRPLGI